MTTCTRKLEFDAGHRVHGHESKCAQLHGHRYVVEVTANAESLDSIGRVIDFSVLKGRIGTWLDANWDHKLLLWEGDGFAKGILVGAGASATKLGIVYVPFNPTAENMAGWLLDKSNDLLADTGVKVVSVRVWETPNCWADAGR